MADYNSILQECVNIIKNKPILINNVATYNGRKYQNLDDAWDWFEEDLESIKFDRADDVLGFEQAQKLRAELESIFYPS